MTRTVASLAGRVLITLLAAVGLQLILRALAPSLPGDLFDAGAFGGVVLAGVIRFMLPTASPKKKQMGLPAERI